jgi:hypothetical protein
VRVLSFLIAGLFETFRIGGLKRYRMPFHSGLRYLNRCPRQKMQSGGYQVAWVSRTSLRRTAATCRGLLLDEAGRGGAGSGRLCKGPRVRIVAVILVVVRGDMNRNLAMGEPDAVLREEVLQTRIDDLAQNRTACRAWW